LNVAEKRTIITRNEQNEVSPAHRIAGGVRFDGDVELPTAARQAKLESRKSAHRGLNVAKQFHAAARSKKRVVLDV
jgi:hypothetical protein